MNSLLRVPVAAVLAAASLVAQANTTQNDSVVRLPVEVTYASMQTLVNEKAPRTVTGVKADPTDAMYDDTLRWTVHRGDISVSNGGSCIAISMPVSGSATAHGRVGARGWFGRRFASVSMSETAEFAGTVSGCVSFDINPDWTPRPIVDLHLSLNRAEVRLVGRIPVSFRGKVTDEFNSRKDAIVRDVAGQIVTALDLETRVSEAWANMHTVYPVSKEPAVFARVEPRRIVFQRPDFSRPDAVSFGIGLVADIQTTVGRKPNAPKVIPLPAPESTANLPALSNLRMPVAIDFAEVNKALAKKFAAGPLTVDEHGKLAITAARVESRGSGVQLQLEYEVQRPWYLPDPSGELTVDAKLGYNAATQTLAFTGLNYSLETRTELLDDAAYLLKPIVLKAIEGRAKVELAPHLTTLRAKANEQIAVLVPKQSGGVVNLQKVRIDTVVVRDGVLIATVAGDVATQVKIADAKVAMR